MSSFSEEKQTSDLPYKKNEVKLQKPKLHIPVFPGHRRSRTNSRTVSIVCLVLALITFTVLAPYLFAANWNSGLDIKDRLKELNETITGLCGGPVSDENGKQEILTAKAESSYERGDYVMAYAQYSNLHKATSKQLGQNHKETLKAQSHAGYMLVQQWQFERADKVLTEVVSKQRKCPGPDHPETLRTEYYMAHNYYLQGDYVAAEGLTSRVPARQEDLMGTEAVEVVEARTLHGQILIAQEHYTEAHEVLQGVINNKSSHNNARRGKNKIVAQCMCAKALANSGKLAEAQEFIVKTRTEAEDWYGENHPVYIEVRIVEADVLLKQGNYTEAVAIYQQTIATHEWMYKGSKNHPKLITIVTIYARVLREFNHTTQSCEVLRKYRDHGMQVGPEKWKYVTDFNKEWYRCFKPIITNYQLNTREAKIAALLTTTHPKDVVRNLTSLPQLLTKSTKEMHARMNGAGVRSPISTMTTLTANLTTTVPLPISTTTAPRPTSKTTTPPPTSKTTTPPYSTTVPSPNSKTIAYPSNSTTEVPRPNSTTTEIPPSNSTTEVHLPNPTTEVHLSNSTTPEVYPINSTIPEVYSSNSTTPEVSPTNSTTPEVYPTNSTTTVRYSNSTTEIRRKNSTTESANSTTTISPTNCSIPFENPVAMARQYLNTKFPVTLGPTTADSVMSFIESLPKEALPEAYKILFAKISAQNETEDSVTPRAVAALQKHPEVLAELKSLIPSVVTNLFTSNPKCMKMRATHSYLLLTLGSSLKTNNSTTCESNSKVWTFRTGSERKFVSIKAGIGRRDSLRIVQGSESLHSNDYKCNAVNWGLISAGGYSYRWRVVLVNSKDNYYLKFVNAESGYVLDADGKGSVYVHSYNFGPHQHWLLEE